MFHCLLPSAELASEQLVSQISSYNNPNYPILESMNVFLEVGERKPPPPYTREIVFIARNKTTSFEEDKSITLG